jgi:hypothetical protein
MSSDVIRVNQRTPLGFAVRQRFRPMRLLVHRTQEGVVTVMGKIGTARFEVVATAPAVIARVAWILKAM